MAHESLIRKLRSSFPAAKVTGDEDVITIALPHTAVSDSDIRTIEDIVFHATELNYNINSKEMMQIENGTITVKLLWRDLMCDILEYLVSQHVKVGCVDLAVSNIMFGYDYDGCLNYSQLEDIQNLVNTATGKNITEHDSIRVTGWGGRHYHMTIWFK